MSRKTLKRTRLISVIIILAMTIGLAVTALSSSSWTSVSTFAQFKTAIESPTITHIRLTNNIVFPKNGVEINGNKAELVINGNGFTLESHASNVKNDSLRYARAGKLANITFENITIISHNFNGFINVATGNNMANVVVAFRNINYFGSQLVSALDSTVIIGDGNYTIRGGHCKLAYELAEAKHIRIENNVTIFKDAKGKDEIFKIERAGGGITVATNAHVNVTLNQFSHKSHNGGFVHFSRADGYLRFENDSYFNFVGNGFFQQCKDVNEVIIGERAQVHIRTHGNFKGCYGIFMISGRMVVGEDSIVNLIATGNTKKEPVIQLDKKTSTITVNNPKQFFVYNSSTKGTKGQAIGTSSCTNVANVFYNNISAVSYWRDNTSPHDNLSPATFVFMNDDLSSFSLFSSSTRSKVTNVGGVNYNGQTPFNSNTALLKDVNVIHIVGGIDIETPKYLVSFDSNGGTSVPWQEVERGDTARMPENPYRPGMLFVGWFEDYNLEGDPWNFDTEIYEDTILYAKWAPIEVEPIEAEEPEQEVAPEPEDEILPEPEPIVPDPEPEVPEQEDAILPEPEAEVVPEPEPAPEPAPESDEE